MFIINIFRFIFGFIPIIGVLPWLGIVFDYINMRYWGVWSFIITTVHVIVFVLLLFYLD